MNEIPSYEEIIREVEKVLVDEKIQLEETDYQPVDIILSVVWAKCLEMEKRIELLDEEPLAANFLEQMEVIKESLKKVGYYHELLLSLFIRTSEGESLLYNAAWKRAEKNYRKGKRREKILNYWKKLTGCFTG